MNEKLKPIIYWVGLGASLVVYANSNFATKEQVDRNTKKLESVVTKEDFNRLEVKIDAINTYLLNKK
jgi:hypothetical protein